MLDIHNFQLLLQLFPEHHYEDEEIRRRGGDAKSIMERILRYLINRLAIIEVSCQAWQTI